ncbi:MAG: ribulose 1,5-bisphosphate carboxylase large subunit [Deltaproteobacteria bacterium]|nr:ribulose 1,5-bisphosphate carboxylase large subunit [Deltaproteobacteria bacterium]
MEGILATYRIVAADRAEAEARAVDVCIEQTVEVTPALCADPVIADRTVARLEGLEPSAPGRWDARVRFPEAVLSAELPQVVNCLYGNVSMKPGVRLVGVALAPSFARLLAGPRHGIAGVRALLGVPHRPLLMSALKPVGRTVAELASYAHAMAAGGIDLVKDDHGIANQACSPFEARVEACAAAVARANAATGGRTLYCPTVTGPADEILRRAEHARDAGAGGLLVSPLVTGLDAMRAVAATTGLPVMAHPALAGAFFPHDDHGISPEVLLGTLMRMAGADLVVFPSWGGRFPFTRETCARLDAALKADLCGLAPALPVPAGGMTLDRVPAMLSVFGRDVVFLIGSALYERSPDLVANAAYFRSLVS